MSKADKERNVSDELTLEEAFELLEDKLEKLESDDISLEDSFKVRSG